MLSRPTWPNAKKVIRPLKLITGCATLDSKNCNKVVHINVKEYEAILSTELFKLSHTGAFYIMNGLFKVTPKHPNQSTLKPWKNLNLYFFSQSEVDLPMCFWVIFVVY